MDPTMNLEMQRRLAARLVVRSELGQPIGADDAVRLAELVIALDEWLARGGFLPSQWAEVTRRAAPAVQGGAR